jgi:hypothetical protein
MIKKSVAGVIILLFLLSSLIPITSSYSSYETNKVYSIHIDETGTLSGYVTDPAMNPIEGARVRVYFHETYEENYTDSSGYYNVTNIPICWCLKNATASKEGYRSECVLLSIDETTIHNFVLTLLGNTLYVGGSGPGNYSRIQDAIDNASDGDTVFVYSGIYYENIVVDKSIDLIGENRDTTIIDANYFRSVIFIWVNNTIVKGFTLQHSEDNYCGCGIYIAYGHNVGSNIIIEDNRIIENHHGIMHPGLNCVIRNNIISDSYEGIRLSFYGNQVISRNIFSNISSNALFSSSIVVGMVNISNNTFLNNGGCGILLYISFTAGCNIVFNNFISNSENIQFVIFPLCCIGIKRTDIEIINGTAFSYRFNNNYWDNWFGLGPKIIKGKLGLSLKLSIFLPMFMFDWHPAKEPYDIPMPGVP